MKPKIYAFLRKVFKLPRPNEIWGEKAENEWDLFNIFLYIKFAINHFASYIGFVGWLIQTLGIFGLYLGTGVLFFGVAVITGAALMFIAGHILIVLGTMKREGNLAASQNEPTLKLLENTKKILDKLDKVPEALPCPHGRTPFNGQDGWKHCPHCLGINQ